MGEIDWTRHPAVKDWYARLKSRPAFRPLLADKVSGLAAAPHYHDPDF
jgi:glutathione S-transferase